MRSPIDQEHLDKILADDSENVVYAAKHEGPDWTDFHSFFYTQHSEPTLNESRLHDLLTQGYKIFIVPSEKRLYDAISGTIHIFDRNGRGEITQKWVREDNKLWDRK